MKTLITMLLVAAPAAAQAMGMGMGMHGSMMKGCCGGCSGAGTHLAVVLYALLAALGYWVLQHSAKEAANYVKRTGQALGWALAVIGLLGALCGIGSHAKNMCHKGGRCSGGEMMMQQGKMEGDMPMMNHDCPMKGGMMKKAEAAPQKK